MTIIEALNKHAQIGCAIEKDGKDYIPIIVPTDKKGYNICLREYLVKRDQYINEQANSYGHEFKVIGVYVHGNSEYDIIEA